MKYLSILLIIASTFIQCKNKCATCKTTMTTTVTGSSISAPPYTYTHEECGANLRSVNGKKKTTNANGVKSTTITNCY
jgi:hypothetical protein